MATITVINPTTATATKVPFNTDSYRANYVALTYGKSRQVFLEECFTADIIIGPEDDHLDMAGARFGIMQLPGHSAGHIGIVTPDGVAYVGDCLIDRDQIAAAKRPRYRASAVAFKVVGSVSIHARFYFAAIRPNPAHLLMV